MLNFKAIFSSVGKIVGQITKDKGPEIALGVGTVSMGLALYATAKAAPKAAEGITMLENCEFESKGEKVEAYCREVVRPYLPAMGFTTMALVGFYGSHILERRRTAAAIAALTMIDQSYTAYREHEARGGSEDSKDDIETINEPVPSKELLQGTGDTLFYDKVTGRWFLSTKDVIRKGEANVARQCANELRAPLNDLYSEWSIDDMSYAGEALGFDDKCLPDISFRAVLGPHQEPALALIYSTTVIDRDALRR